MKTYETINAMWHIWQTSNHCMNHMNHMVCLLHNFLAVILLKIHVTSLLLQSYSHGAGPFQPIHLSNIEKKWEKTSSGCNTTNVFHAYFDIIEQIEKHQKKLSPNLTWLSMLEYNRFFWYKWTIFRSFLVSLRCYVNPWFQTFQNPWQPLLKLSNKIKLRS